MKRILALILSLVMAVSFTACGNRQPAETQAQEEDLLRIGMEKSSLNGVFSPFFTEWKSDRDIMELTQIRLLTCDRAGKIVFHGIEGETRPFCGTEYTYYGPANVDVTEHPDGTVSYDITLREGLKFSDGTPVTIDDVMFSLYVLCDPSYQGPNQLKHMPIQGIEEQRSNQVKLSALLAKLGEDNQDFSAVTEEQQTIFWDAVHHGLVAFAQSLIDSYQQMENAECEGEEEPLTYTPMVTAEAFGWGQLSADATVQDLAWTMGEYFHWDFQKINEFFTRESILKLDTLPELLGEVYSYSETVVKNGEGETVSISGIQKTGADTLRIVMNRFDVNAIYWLGSVYIAPIHYYGDTSLFDDENGTFGFPKGDLSGIRKKDEAPMGAGPYRFVAYSGEEISFEANEHYYLGAPKIDCVEVVCQDGSGTIEYGAVDFVYKEHTSGEAVQDEQISAGAEAYPGMDTAYSYIGINPGLINIDGEPDSKASKCLRRGIATVIAACRERGLEESEDYNSYRIMNAPISTSAWVSPDLNAVYARDENGGAIYDPDMTLEERETAAVKAALGLFEAAGYTVEEGKITDAPDSAPEGIEAVLWLDETAPEMIAMRTAERLLTEMGLDFKIVNAIEKREEDENYVVPDAGESAVWSGIWDDSALTSGWIDGRVQIPWCAAAEPSAHLRKIYFSDAENDGKHAGEHAHVLGVEDPLVDELILEGESTVDYEERADIYRQCFDQIEGWACEVPMFQNQDTWAYRRGKIKEESVPRDLTCFYGWIQEIHKLTLSSK